MAYPPPHHFNTLRQGATKSIRKGEKSTKTDILTEREREKQFPINTLITPITL